MEVISLIYFFTYYYVLLFHMFIHYFKLTPQYLHVLQETVLLVCNHWLTGTPKWNAAIVNVTPAGSKFKI